MSRDIMVRTMNEILPDSVVEEELRAILRQAQEEGGNAPVELNGNIVSVPVDVDIEVVTKAFFEERHDAGFPTGFRVQVAIGGISSNGVLGLVATYCFATLFFNAEGRRFTVDFHTKMR